MKAGRELDVEVAEKIFGHQWGIDEGDYILKEMDCTCKLGGSPHMHWSLMPHYSADMTAAWKVVEKLKDFGYDLFTVKFYLDASPKSRRVLASFCKDDQTAVSRRSASAPFAICQAALAAVGETK
jgi:hypothetical protein